MQNFHINISSYFDQLSKKIAKRLRWKILFYGVTPLLLPLLLYGCGERGIHRPADIDEFVQRSHATESIIQEPFFDIFTMLKGQHGATLRVYLEGDGVAWLDKRTVSADPTPKNPVALQLAAIDPFPLILYVGRPCQYVTGENRRNCLPQVWTSARFCEPVRDDINSVINKFKIITGANEIELVGYSGGGGLAVLIAAIREDVSGILTIAGNLDHRAWTKLHNVSPLVDSLNPIDFAGAISQIPQLHVAGADDSVVPPSIAHSFVLLQKSNTSERLTIPAVGHNGNWSGEYPKIMVKFKKLLTH